MENISIYTDKESKSLADNSQNYSSFAYSNTFMDTKKPFWLNDEEDPEDKLRFSSEIIRQHLLKSYKSHIHYNSSEPEKFGMKAFTKNGEVYLASGAKDSLEHELAHVYQQKTKNVSITTKIGKEKVNFDPKLEKEANEIAKHIENYIPEIVSEQANKNKDLIQFDMLSDEELQYKIKEQAANMGMPSDLIMDSVIKKTKEYYYSWGEYFKSYFYTSWFKDYLDVCIKWALQSIKIENELKIENACSTKLFEPYSGADLKSLKEAKYYYENKEGSNKRMIDDKQYKKIINCLEKLSNYCDEKGLISILEGANTNVIASYSMLNFIEDDDENSNGRDYFVKRLVLMSNYIEEVAKQKDVDGRRFGEKYWVRSTGSDPHYKGHHALFFVNKRDQEGCEHDDSKKAGKIAKVYKPHDLTGDNAVVGKGGIFDKINEKIDIDKTILKGEKSFATMDIDAKYHTEKFVTKKKSMTQEEAKKYFFRAGMLKVITDAMAVIDLHCDNIMPIEQGPIIIDAEINFFHYGENSSLVGGNAPALSTDEIGYNRANASFDIEEDPASQTFTPSGQAFSNNIFSCKDKYNEGYNFMLNQLKSRKEEFSNLFYDQLNALCKDSKIRILPLPTQDFAGFLDRVINQGHEESKVVNELKDTITTNLTSENAKFLNSKKIKVELNDQHLKEALLTTFKNGTIPAMYADMDGNLYLDDEIVGKIVSKIDNGELKVNDQLSEQQMVNIMKDCFLSYIENSVTL